MKTFLGLYIDVVSTLIVFLVSPILVVRCPIDVLVAPRDCPHILLGWFGLAPYAKVTVLPRKKFKDKVITINIHSYRCEMT
jgi:hypothetical protein